MAACSCAGQAPGTSSTGSSPRLTLAEVLRAATAHVPSGSLPPHHWKTLNALMACRTPALGGHLYRCEDCEHQHFVPHSCRNRHCPLCQKSQAIQWQQKQEADLLPVPYFHVVFTLPHALNALIAQNRRALYNLLFSSASATLLTFGDQRFGAQIGLIAVLHTWSQRLGPHYHLHCIVTGGGLCPGGQRWRRISAGYLFPVKALSLVFRAKFRDGLKKLYSEGALSFHGQLATLHDPVEFRRLLATALGQKWVVFAKPPFGGPREVLAYLSRYTHRVAIGNGRLIALDSQQGTVSFSYKDYADHDRRKIMTLSLKEFLHRFTLHILPPRFVKIRHYGLLGNHQRKAKLAQARRLLGVCAPQHEEQGPGPPAPQAPVAAPATAFYPTCPRCGSANLILVERYCRPPPFDSS